MAEKWTAQRYTHPVALERMAQGLCPECGCKAENHETDWYNALFAECDLRPDGVKDRIAQFKEDNDGRNDDAARGRAVEAADG